MKRWEVQVQGTVSVYAVVEADTADKARECAFAYVTTTRMESSFDSGTVVDWDIGYEFEKPDDLGATEVKDGQG